MVIAGTMIRADGLEWPLETFIDAYGFTRTTALADHSIMGRDDVLQAITSDGEMITGQLARHLPWGEVLAIKPAHGDAFRACDNCDDPAPEQELCQELANGDHLCRWCFLALEDDE